MSDDLVKMCTRLSQYAHAQLSSRDLERIANRIKELDAKLAKAMELVEEAYSEGFAEGHDGGWIEGDYSKPWKKSELFTTLAELKGQDND